MKKLASILVMLGIASTTHGANVRFVSADDSALSEACINLVTSTSRAEVLDINTQGLYCNGMPARSFQRKYKEPDLARVSDERIVLKRGDSSTETALCYAAATRDTDFEELKRRYQGEQAVGDLEEELYCNRMPLRTFVRKFRSAELSASR